METELKEIKEILALLVEINYFQLAVQVTSGHWTASTNETFIDKLKEIYKKVEPLIKETNGN
jgi:hypothetical protein